MGRFADDYEYTMYAQINRALRALRAGDWGLAGWPLVRGKASPTNLMCRLLLA